jgi:hypothetical protein
MRKVFLTVYQPRINNISKYAMHILGRTNKNKPGIEIWIEENVLPAVIKIQLKSTELVPGQWCWFCKAKNICPEIERKRVLKAIEAFDTEV